MNFCSASSALTLCFSLGLTSVSNATIIDIDSLAFEDSVRCIENCDKVASQKKTKLLERRKKELAVGAGEDKALKKKCEKNQLSNETLLNYDEAQPVNTEDEDVPDNDPAALAKAIEDLSQILEEENKSPRKNLLRPNSQVAGYPSYYNELRKKIENRGTLHFPKDDGCKLYGQLSVNITLFQSGAIAEDRGGIEIIESSGIAALDSAALKIIRSVAPFKKFPKNMRTSHQDDVWVIYTKLNFTRQ